MTNNIIVVTDLGPGDGGKGGVVHKLSTLKGVHTVIKDGGGQGSHGVFTSGGESHAFSYWGCGTFGGIPTHISSRLIIFPVGLLNESEMLRYQNGIHNVFELLTVDENVVCSTSYHGIASRLKELARGKNSRGTIGTGIGEAHRMSQLFPDLTIRARDLLRPDIKDLLAAVRRQTQINLNEIIKGEFLPEDREEAEKEIFCLQSDDFLDYATKRFLEAGQKINIVDSDYLGKRIISQEGIAIVERSHGILTDHFNGFHPHTSAIRTLPSFAEVMLREAGYMERIINLAVSRAYSIRHGAGPMPTGNPMMTENLLPNSHKDPDRYQGEVRVGPLDLVLLRYAIEVCGGPTAFDGIAITWFDQIQTNKAWKICDRYQGTEDRNFFTPTGEIKVRRSTDIAQLNHQEALGKQLMSCAPEITTLEVPSTTDRKNLFSFCADVLQQKIDVPVKMVSFGPTERDKICK